VSKQDTLGAAFEMISAHRISSVPVWNSSRRVYERFIDILDIVSYVVSSLGTPETGLALTALPTIATLPDFSVNAVDWSHANVKSPYEPMDDRASILHAMEWMRKTGAQRIPVVDNAGELQTIVTESGILKFLHAEVVQFPQHVASLAQLNLSSTPFHAIQSTARAIDAFRLIAKHRVGAVAVLNEKHEIVGNISATDLRVINSTGGFSATLFLPAYYFTRLCREPNSPTAEPIVATSATTLAEVIKNLVTHKIHQIYVTKGSSNEVSGVVDLRSILQVLHILP